MPLRKTERPTRITFGDNGHLGKRGLVSVTLMKQDLYVPKTASNTSVSAALASSNTAATTYNIGVELTPSRNIKITCGGTAASIAASPIVVTGKNFEGKVITESFTPTAGTAGTLVAGSKIFTTVDSISIPQQTGTGATFSIGVGNNIGFNFRNLSTTQVRLYKKVISSGAESLVAPGSTNFSSTNVEDNWLTLDVVPSGLSQYRVYALNYNWHLNPINNEPVYGV